MHIYTPFLWYICSSNNWRTCSPAHIIRYTYILRYIGDAAPIAEKDELSANMMHGYSRKGYLTFGCMSLTLYIIVVGSLGWCHLYICMVKECSCSCTEDTVLALIPWDLCYVQGARFSQSNHHIIYACSLDLYNIISYYHHDDVIQSLYIIYERLHAVNSFVCKLNCVYSYTWT